MKILKAFMSAVAFLWGGFWYQQRFHENHQLHAALKHKPLEITGILEDKEHRPASRYPEITTIRIASIATPEKTINDCRGSAKIFFKQPIAAASGDKIIIRHVFAARARDSAQNHALKEGLVLTAFVSHQNYTIVTNHQTTFLTALRCFCIQMRQSLMNKLHKKMNPENFSLFPSLFMGAPVDNSDEMTQMRKGFNHWGIAHYLARSGLHVLIMLLTWQCFMRLIPIRLGFKNMFLLIILLLCSALSWSSISFTRALLSYSLARCFFASGLQTHAIQLILLTILLVLAHNPFHLFFLNFQLSFALAFALAWISEVDFQTRRKIRTASSAQIQTQH
jgi:ComEC/Rec2-related protein